MKKSELYHLAQCAVLDCGKLTNGSKLEILRELIACENLALFTEKQKERESEL